MGRRKTLEFHIHIKSRDLIQTKNFNTRTKERIVNKITKKNTHKANVLFHSIYE